jgi:hypothetical protein
MSNVSVNLDEGERIMATFQQLNAHSLLLWNRTLEYA